MIDLILKNCNIINYDKRVFGNILIKDEIIVDIIPDTLSDNIESHRILDCKNNIVMPAFIDMHTHLRDPGYEYKEDIESASLAALAGGFTTCLSMANTEPPADNKTVIRYIIEKSKNLNLIDILPYGSVTVGRKGKQLVEMGILLLEGAVAFSDDGSCIMNAEVSRRAMEYAKTFNSFIAIHAEDHNLSENGQINEGKISTLTGLKGIPKEAEESMIFRDIVLADLTKSHLHICHLSTKRSVELVRWAKKQGINITAEATPHHIYFTEESLKGYDTNYKVKPPLKRKQDIDSLIDGLRDGTIDVIATDHAPHHLDEKYIEFESAEFGMTGLQTALPILIKQIEENKLAYEDVARVLCYNPAKILGINKGYISKNYTADIIVIDPNMEYIFDDKINKSKSINTPFYNKKLKGTVIYTIKSGSIIYKYF